ncbi:tetratricopeptide repeat protein [Pseudanabaena sp. PCC 6802]|uniref:O-linked N-acetylglucosamine transferase, SPINDLY family protein n=1 Tax=Pseudanabaena sp. PCC 6802 TaxID=118173 RepID=UPI00034C6DB0|nr:tetratricopeptide repeat protein [Pseudanabaena sp. PCC 6802]
MESQHKKQLEIKRHSRDLGADIRCKNQPKDINDILKSLALSIPSGQFILNEDGDLQHAISLLPTLSPTQVNGTLLLQVVQQALASDRTTNSTAQTSAALVAACMAHYQNALAKQGEVAEWHYRLGTIHAEVQHISEAIACYNKAINLNPDYAEVYFSLGNITLNQQEYERAIALYQKAIQLKPEFAKPYVNLAFIWERQGKLDEAIDNLEQAVRLQPDFAEAHSNLAALLYQNNLPEQAIASYRIALDLKPEYLPARLGLVTALIQSQKLDEAFNYLQHLPETNPSYSITYYELGIAYARQNRLDEAIACYQNTLRTQPQHVEAWENMGNAMYLQGMAEAAIDCYQQVLTLDSDRPNAYRKYRLTLPIMYDTAEQIEYWRQRFTQGLTDFSRQIDIKLETGTEVDKLWALDSIKVDTNFYLPYQAQNDLDLQTQYGRTIHRIMAANYPQWIQPLEMPPIAPGEKIRIGYISNYLRMHSGGRWVLNWLRYRDRQTFEVYSYLVDSKADFFTKEFERESDCFHHIPDDIEKICDRVRADNLHILVFTDLNMHPLTTQLAGLRLAPVQCNCWGHPVTSGLPTIDYYLSSALMEPDDARSHYSETLVRLPKLGFSYSKPVLPTVRKCRVDFGLPEDAIVYLCSQSLYKYLPQYDYIFAAIAQHVSKAKFLFLANRSSYVTEQFCRRLYSAFDRVGLNSQDFCIIFPGLYWQDYLNLNLVSDIFLDTFDWSGGNSSLEAIACGLPIVTCPGEFMRGRHTYAFLQIIGTTETIAQTEDEYIEIATKLGLDSTWRQAIIDKMQERLNLLYEDITCVQGLEAFYKSVILERS